MSEITLSIIIPCYNCEATIDEAIASIFSQNIKYNIEVILVNDGSTDSTKNKLYQLQKQYPTIKILHNTKNCGGGFTRNKGFKHSVGRYVMFFDSDNIIESESINNFIHFLNNNNCDCAHYNYFKRFSKTKDHYKLITFEHNYPTINHYFTHMNWIDNPVFKRKSFEKIKGYPEHHHFDSQGLWTRILAHNLNLQIAPNTTLYHRFFAPKISYFEQEHSKGHTLINDYLIIEEFIPLLSSSTIDELLTFDPFTVDNKTCFTQFLKQRYQDSTHNFLNECSNGSTRVQEQNDLLNLNDTSPSLLFTQAIHHFNTGNYQKALKSYEILVTKIELTPLLLYNITRCYISLNEQNSPIETTYKALYLLNNTITIQKKLSLRPSFLKKLKEKLISFF